jgi:DNA-binding transcriptional regulator YiaG
MVNLDDIVEQAREQARLRRELPTRRRRKAIREAVGLSQAAFARALGVDPATVCRWESGVREPRGSQLARYLEALDQLARKALA